MSSTIAVIHESNVISNLDTYTFTVQVAGMHTADIKLSELPPSGISLTIKQNSTTIASSSSPAAQQSALNLQATMNCSISDVISVIVASSSAQDMSPNAIKGIITIRQGSN